MTPIRWLVAVLVVLGLLAVAAAVVYFAVPAHSLPSFLGTLHGVKAHRTRRGTVALIVGIVLWVLAAALYFAGSRGARRVSTGA
jgi:hypothetical protein